MISETAYEPGPSSAWEERLAAVSHLVPEAVVEGALDPAALLDALGLTASGEGERFLFSWAGRRDALRNLQAPVDATLRAIPEASVSFEVTKNVFVEGDNLEVLKLLHAGYFGQVKMIFIDPPYNTGKDFIYPDNYASPIKPYLELTGQVTEEGAATTTKLETSGRVHSRWLSFLYPRLFVARQLLRDDGVICVSIDDNEVHNLRQLMNEVFGEENFIASVIWQKKYTRSNDATWFSATHDYILIYGKSRNEVVLNAEPRNEAQKKAYRNPNNHSKGPWKATPLHAKSGRDRDFVHVFSNGVEWRPPAGTFSRFSHASLDRFFEDDEIRFGKDGEAQPSRKTFLSDIKDGVTPVTIWSHEDAGHTHEANNELKDLNLAGVFDNPKPTKLIKRLVRLCTSAKDEDLVLDFFAGSGTTGHAVMAQNAEDGGSRRFLLVQLPEPTDRPAFKTIAGITAERLRRAGKAVGGEVDTGFRYFALTASNIRPLTSVPVAPTERAEEYVAALLQDEDRLIPGWTPEAVAWEVVISEARHLTATLQPAAVKDTLVVKGAGQSTRLIVCLADAVEPEQLQSELSLESSDTLVCRETALDDTAAANLALQCRFKSI